MSSKVLSSKAKLALALVTLPIAGLLVFLAVDGKSFACAAFDPLLARLIPALNSLNAGKDSGEAWEISYLNTVWSAFNSPAEIPYGSPRVRWWRERILEPELNDAVNEIISTDGSNDALEKLRKESKNRYIIEWTKSTNRGSSK